jgi:hypothetical protein
MMTLARFSLGRIVLHLIAMLREVRDRRALGKHINEEFPQLAARIQHTGANEWTSYVP